LRPWFLQSYQLLIAALFGLYRGIELLYDCRMSITTCGILASVFLLASGAEAQVAAPATCKTIPTGAQDALIASPANHTVLFENADVRVLDVHSQPHTREAVHTHVRPSVMYIDRQGAGTYDTPDGSDHRSHPTDPNFKPRIVAIKPEGPHWTENTGEVPFHAIRVEFKHPGCGLPGWNAAVPAADDAVVAAPANHTVLFENADVRVLDVHLAPGAKEPEHTHPWPGFFYVVSAPPVKFYYPGMAPVPRVFPAGEKIVPIGAQGLHAAENVGDVPLHLIRFELKYGFPVQ
jgi:mannose-6-phosphate isomerase-like protein (cupin superfamily)